MRRDRSKTFPEAGGNHPFHGAGKIIASFGPRKNLRTSLPVVLSQAERLPNHGRIETRLNAARCQQAAQPGADLILPTGLDDLFVCLFVKVFRGLLGCLCCMKPRGIRVINGAAGGRRVGVLLVAVFPLKESEEGA